MSDERHPTSRPLALRVWGHIVVGVLLALLLSVALFDTGPGFEPQHLLAVLIGGAAGYGVAVARRSTEPDDR